MSIDEIKSVSSNGLIFIKKNSGNGYFNINGEEVISAYDGKEFNEEGLAVACSTNDLYGIVNEKGEWVIEPFADGLSTVNKNGYFFYKPKNSKDSKWGIMNIDGSIVVEPKFYEQGLNPLSDNGFALATLGKDEKYGIINEKGEWVVEQQIDISNAGKFNENGVANVKSNGKYGIINEKGEYLIEADLDDYKSTLAKGWVGIKNEQEGIIGPDGKWIIEPF